MFPVLSAFKHIFITHAYASSSLQNFDICVLFFYFLSQNFLHLERNKKQKIICFQFLPSCKIHSLAWLDSTWCIPALFKICGLLAPHQHHVFCFRRADLPPLAVTTRHAFYSSHQLSLLHELSADDDRHLQSIFLFMEHFPLFISTAGKQPSLFLRKDNLITRCWCSWMTCRVKLSSKMKAWIPFSNRKASWAASKRSVIRSILVHPLEAFSEHSHRTWTTMLK